jgi:hypothetical protein
MRNSTPLILLITGAIICTAGALRAQYQISHGVFAGGAGVRSGSHIVYDTSGQQAIGLSSGSSHIVKSGFWYAAGISSTVDVAIAAFTAELIDDAVELHWSMSTGGEMSGFNVYRAEGGAETLDRINADALPARTTASYRDETVVPGKRYRYQIAGVCGEREIRSATLVVQVPPKPLTLYQNYPNPFNPATSISFFLPDRANVLLEIFDIGGRRVRTLVNGAVASGRHVVAWDGRNQAGVSVASGVYCCRLQGGKKTLTRKMAVIR